MKRILFTLSVVFPAMVLAHGSKVETVEQATVVALEKFEKEETEAVVKAFNAVKSWVSGAKIKVKAYYKENEERVLYECQIKHVAEEEEMVCDKQ